MILCYSYQRKIHVGIINADQVKMSQSW